MGQKSIKISRLPKGFIFLNLLLLLLQLALRGEVFFIYFLFAFDSPDITRGSSILLEDSAAYYGSQIISILLITGIGKIWALLFDRSTFKTLYLSWVQCLFGCVIYTIFLFIIFPDNFTDIKYIITLFGLLPESFFETVQGSFLIYFKVLLVIILYMLFLVLLGRIGEKKNENKN